MAFRNRNRNRNRNRPSPFSCLVALHDPQLPTGSGIAAAASVSSYSLLDGWQRRRRLTGGCTAGWLRKSTVGSSWRFREHEPGERERCSHEYHDARLWLAKGELDPPRDGMVGVCCRFPSYGYWFCIFIFIFLPLSKIKMVTLIRSMVRIY